jgi:hypothetical protein
MVESTTDRAFCCPTHIYLFCTLVTFAVATAAMWLVLEEMT